MLIRTQIVRYYYPNTIRLPVKTNLLLNQKNDRSSDTVRGETEILSKLGRGKEAGRLKYT
jgi:hypothetical protein